MAEGLTKFLIIVAGSACTIIGLGGVPLSVVSGNATNLVLFTIMMFGGIGILGWVYK